MQEEQQQTLASRYRVLEGERQPYLDRAREAARVTIPSLMPPQGSRSSSKITLGHQSMGARGVNHLASKLTLTLLPPNRPFHRTTIDEISISKLTKQPGAKAEILDNLAKYDRAMNDHIEAGQLRFKSDDIFKQLLIAGTVVVHLIDEQQVRVYRLDSFVQQLDNVGNLLELITHDEVAPETLDAEVRDACQIDAAKMKVGKRTGVDVYTCVSLQLDGKYRVWQEINDIVVPGSQGTFTKDNLPFLSIPFTAVDGEHYGRSYVEYYIGDLVSIEGHSRSLNEGAILANRYIFLVSHGATTNIRQLERARNGAVLRGSASDISVLRVDKANDMRVGLEVLNGIENRLSYAFLLNSAIQRNGERVTAEEIKVMARELEEGLGGVYSLLSQKFQLPVIRAYRSILEKAGKLPSLPKAIVSVKVVTGLEALGRGQDVDQLRQYLGDVASLAPTAVNQLNTREILLRLATARGIDTTDLVKSQEQLAQEQQNAMMQQMAQQAGPGLIQQAVTAGQPQQ